MESVKKSLAMILILQGLMFVGCGEVTTENKSKNDTNVLGTTETIEEPVREVDNSSGKKNLLLAKDNSLHDINSTFKNYRILLYTNKVLGNKLSNSTKAVYGNIDGENTASLLTINDNYRDGDIFTVKVFSKSLLVGESKELKLTGKTLNFGDIVTKKKEI